MAMIGIGDGLPASEVSVSALKVDARKRKSLVRCNEFGQPLDGTPIVEEEEDVEEGVKVLVEGDASPAPLVSHQPPAPKPQITSQPVVTTAFVAPMSEVVGKVSFKANHMEMKIPILGMTYSSPAVMIFTPIDSDTVFQPPARIDGVEIKIPGGIQGLPPGVPGDTWLSVYVTGLYFDIQELGVQASVFFIQEGGE